MRALLARTLRAAAIVARDRRIPRPLRGLAALGAMPIPGPFDELLLLVLAPVFALLYRTPMREAWEQAARSPEPAI